MESNLKNLIQHISIKSFFSFLPLLLLFATNNMLIAQEKKPLKGLILIDFRDIPASDVLVENRNTQEKVSSDLSGGFYINSSVGDTLSFKGDFIEDRKLIIKDHFFELNPLIVHLNIETIKLDSIIIKQRLTGFLKEDVETVQLSNDIERVYANLGLDIRTRDMEPKEKQGTILPEVFGIPVPVSLNIESFAKHITGYYRRQKSLRKYENFSASVYKAKNHFGDAYFTKELDIPKDEIFNFLTYVSSNSNGQYAFLVKTEDFLSLDALFKQKKIGYLMRLKTRI